MIEALYTTEGFLGNMTPRYRAKCNCGASQEIPNGVINAQFAADHYEHGISIQQIIGPDLRQRTAKFRRQHLSRSATS